MSRLPTSRLKARDLRGRFYGILLRRMRSLLVFSQGEKNRRTFFKRNLMKRIIKLDKGKFRIHTPEAPEVPLMLDFIPIIEQFGLSGDFCLIHWQARPKPWRQWGVYESYSDSYVSVTKIDSDVRFVSLQLNDATCSTLTECGTLSSQ